MAMKGNARWFYKHKYWLPLWSRRWWILDTGEMAATPRHSPVWILRWPEGFGNKRFVARTLHRFTTKTQDLMHCCQRVTG